MEAGEGGKPDMRAWAEQGLERGNMWFVQLKSRGEMKESSFPSEPAKGIAAQDLQVSSSRKDGSQHRESSANVENLPVI